MKIHWYMYALGLALLPLGYPMYGIVCLVGAVVVNHQVDVERRRQAGERQQKTNSIDAEDENVTLDAENLSVAFGLPVTEEHGWHSVEVFPTKRRYMRECCFGGPPTWEERYEYDLRLNDYKVFARLIDKVIDGFYGKRYEVVNGCVCENVVSRAEHEEAYIQRLKSDVAWHEVLGAERYAILSAHGVERSFFERERERLTKAITEVKAEADKLGAIWEERFCFYESPVNATEEDKAAIRRMQSDANLERYDISFFELTTQRQTMEVLNEVGKQQPV